MNKIRIKEKTRSLAIFWNKEEADRGKNVQATKLFSCPLISQLARQPQFERKRQHGFQQMLNFWSLSPECLGAAWKNPSDPLFQVQNPKRLASLSQIPHWRCSETKCNERELNTPKVSENLVRFTFPVFTVGDRPSSWKYFQHISQMWREKSLKSSEMWIWIKNGKRLILCALSQVAAFIQVWFRFGTQLPFFLVFWKIIH